MSTTSLKKVFPTPGQLVTVRRSQHAYYSGDCGTMQCLRPDLFGVVYKMTPYVSSGGYTRYDMSEEKRRCKCQDFAVVDFIGDDGRKWRVGLDPHNIVLVRES